MPEPFLEIQQDPDMTDSEMIEVIKEKIGEGWSLSEYKWQDGVKIWLFES